MTLLKTLDIASAGMSVQRVRMNVASMNIANKNTTRTPEGGPYRRRSVAVESVPAPDNAFAMRLEEALGNEPGQSVRISEVALSDDEPILVYDPGHPDADETGHVAMPNVSGIKEMVDMLGAARAYEAGTTVVRTVREMADQALRLGR